MAYVSDVPRSPGFLTKAYEKPARRVSFKAAFHNPKFFRKHGTAFEGMLEPGVKVPFGAGWVDVDVDFPEEVESVRVTVDSFWAMGGGINEIQVYAADEE